MRCNTIKSEINITSDTAITIVDSIMGSGKTSAMINQLNRNCEKNYIYITPFLSEVERIINKTNFDFKQPENHGKGKLDGLHYLLASGENIVSTHALFLKATQETIQLIYEGGYTLILDEALDVLHDYNSIVKEFGNKTITKDDVGWLIQEKHITVDENYNVYWNSSTNENFHYSEIQRLAENHSLRCVDNILLWEFPYEIFKAFSSIYVLTYQFSNSMLDAFMLMNGLKYQKVSAHKFNNSFQLCDYNDDFESRNSYAELINIYEGNLNKIGDKTNAFSVSWLTGCGEKQNQRTNDIKKAIRNYKNHIKASTSEIMWTTAKKDNFHEKIESVKGFKYIHKLTSEEKSLPENEFNKLKCFVPCNSRATNNFSDRTTLLYLLNRYVQPEYAKYFSKRGYPIDNDQFALNEMLQWIWRSAIRNGEKINIYIPSSRMRNLLYNWLGKNTPCT